MNAKEIMSPDVACCTPDTTLREAARAMAENDCGCIPVVEDGDSRKLRGVITDRDITCRAVANDKDSATKVVEIMSTEVTSVKVDTPLEEVERLMEERQIRRIPVVTDNGSCCGIISQADIALSRSDTDIADVVKGISKPQR